MQCLTHMLTKQVRAVEIKDDVNNAYNEEVQKISKTLAWAHPGVQSWYKNSDGVVVNNSTITNNQVTSIATISQELLICSNFCFLSRNFKTYLIDVFKDIASLYREGSFAIVTSKLSVSNNTRLSSQR